MTAIKKKEEKTIDNFNPHKYFKQGKYCISKQFLKEKLEEFEKKLEICEGGEPCEEYWSFTREDWQKFKQSLVGEKK